MTPAHHASAGKVYVIELMASSYTVTVIRTQLVCFCDKQQRAASFRLIIRTLFCLLHSATLLHGRQTNPDLVSGCGLREVRA